MGATAGNHPKRRNGRAERELIAQSRDATRALRMLVERLKSFTDALEAEARDRTGEDGHD